MREHAAARHGVARVDDEVHRDLLELARIAADLAQICRELRLECDVLVEKLFRRALASIWNAFRSACDAGFRARSIRKITINEMQTMDRHLAELLLPARLGAIILVAISALALGLAVIGLYGMVSYAVARRTREVGIRMSIGADRGSVVRLMMTSGVKLVAAGAAAACCSPSRCPPRCAAFSSA